MFFFTNTYAVIYMLPKNAHYQFMYGSQNQTCAPVDSLKKCHMRASQNYRLSRHAILTNKKQFLLFSFLVLP